MDCARNFSSGGARTFGSVPDGNEVSVPSGGAEKPKVFRANFQSQNGFWPLMRCQYRRSCFFFPIHNRISAEPKECAIRIRNAKQKRNREKENRKGQSPFIKQITPSPPSRPFLRAAFLRRRAKACSRKLCRRFSKSFPQPQPQILSPAFLFLSALSLRLPTCL